MTATSIISHYNHLNGKSVNIATLRKLHGDIQKFLDNNSTGPHAKTLNELRKRVAMGLKKMAAAGADQVDKLNVKQIRLTEEKTAPVKPAKKVTKRKPEKRKKKKATTGQVDQVDIEMLAGLECNPIEAQEENAGLGFTKEGQNKIYDMITNMILKVMKEEKQLPWQKPWSIDSIYATNLKTKTVYKGANLFLLNLIAPMFFGKTGPYWLTYKQAKQMGGNVKEGAEGFPVIYYNIYYVVQKPERKTITEEQYNAMTKAQKEESRATSLYTINYYTVFAQEDIEGIEFPVHGKRRENAKPIETAQRIIDNMPQRPEIIHHKIGRAFYSPSDDHIKVPEIGYFKQDQEYYSTLFHELIHSTGHKSRLDRFTVNKADAEGKDDYAYEELIAEMGASYLNAEAGTLYFTLKNSASYLKGWQKDLEDIMKSDNKFFLKASAKAAQAADFILNNKQSAPAAETKKEKSKSRKPVKREAPKAKPATMDRSISGLGFVTADQMPDAPVDTFKLPGEVGKLLGDLQAYKLEIIISGETHSSKSELAKQIANAFIKAGYDVGYIDWEHGGLRSKDTQAGINRNIEPGSKNKLVISGEVPRTLEAVKDLAKHFKVVVLDSGTKIKGQLTNAWVDELRESEPDTIWVIAMQQNEKGGTRGGSAAEFDAPVVIKTYRDDINDYRKNYAVVEKNRGNTTGTRYNIASKKIIKPEAESRELKTKDSPLKTDKAA